MKLYTCSTAPNPRRVAIFLAEKGLELPQVEVSIADGEHKKPEYRKIAPNARLPALELDDGRVLLESPSICCYIESLHPEPPLLGRDTTEASFIDMWSRRIELELMMPMAAAFRHTHPGMAQLERQVPEYGQISREAVEKRLKVLDRDLGETQYVAGDSYSMADITLVCTLDFFSAVGKFDLKPHANILRWRSLVGDRPAIAASSRSR
ncbi:MAG: glutathione S-transferase family protein [Gammaproteobacteria bacterium AqS3]|nr:glutathione S-transferase family protein [Gammaproteobacteria bacterium AqS3]